MGMSLCEFVGGHLTGQWMGPRVGMMAPECSQVGLELCHRATAVSVVRSVLVGLLLRVLMGMSSCRCQGRQDCF